MRQDFALYCRSCDKYQINNAPTTLPDGRSLTLPDPDEAYQSLAMDFAAPFNKSDGYTSIMVIMDRFTSYTHLIPLKDAATPEKIFKKLHSSIFEVHGLLLSIVLDRDSRFTSKFWSQMMKSIGIQVWMVTQYHHQTNGQVERRIRTLKQLMWNFVNPRQNNKSGALLAIAAAMNCARHKSLGISLYHALYGRSWNIVNPVKRSASKVPAVDDILNAHEASRMEVDMARKHATFRQTVQADKRHKPRTEPFKNGSRVLVRGRPYTSSPGRSKKLEPRWFGPIKVLEHLPDTDNYKLHLPHRTARQKPYFHVSSIKEYTENDPDRFKSRRMDKPAPILNDNAEEREAERILNYRCQNNRHEFLVHWKGYERGDDCWEPIENLDHSLELIQEYWDANHPAELTPQITFHNIKASSEPMEVSSTPCTANDCPDDFCEPYDNEEYDSSSSEQDYFPTDDDSLLWDTDVSAEDSEDFEMIVDFSE